MRRVLILSFAFAMLSFPSPAAADNPRDLFVIDPVGDVIITGPTSLADSNHRFDHIDVKSFWISNETVDFIEFGVEFARADNPNAAPKDFVPTTNRGFASSFIIGTAEFRLYQDPGQPAGACGAFIRREVESSVSTECVETIADAGPFVRIKLPREELTTAAGLPFQPGQQITSLSLESYASVSGTASDPIVARDRAPDEGTAPAYESRLGNAISTGSLRLLVPDPIRASNGESTTMAFAVTLFNDGPQDDVVELQVIDVPDQWDVRAPSQIPLDAGSNATFPVILSIGFSHKHGEVEVFGISATGSRPSSGSASAELGVYWLEVPQPAGHHNRLWLHSGGLLSRGQSNVATGYQCETRTAWMNALEQDARYWTTDEPIPGCAFGDLVGTSFAERHFVDWWLPMDPRLRIGIDLDLQGTGMLVTSVSSPIPSPSAQLSATFWYCDPTLEETYVPRLGSCAGSWVLAASGESGAAALSAGQARQFEIELAPQHGADVLPYHKGANLGLLINLTSTVPQNAPNFGSAASSPSLVVRGSELVLPLREYHDPVEASLQRIGSLGLELVSASEKSVNPGEHAYFQVNVKNHASSATDVALDVAGHNSEWARVTSPTSIRFGAGETVRAIVGVEVPYDAVPEERAELFLVAQDQDHENVVAATRLRVTVVDSIVLDVEDEVDPATQAEAAQSPAIGFLGAIALMALVLVLRRP